MCGGIPNMQSRPASDRQLHHPKLRHNIVMAQPPHAADHWRRQPPAAPAGLAIVAALVQSGGAKLAAAPTSSPPIPISSATEKMNNREDNNFPAYCSKQRAMGIFSTSLSPPSASDSNIMSSKIYSDELSHDFLGLCLSCNRPLSPGKDIFMYRGDRAFCSTECRHKNIVADESRLCNIKINQQCVQSSSPTNQPKFTPPVPIAIFV